MNLKQGDIIYADFDPSLGHEQAGRRPALIVSNNEFHKLMKLYIVCPITNNTKSFPSHIKLDERTKTTGSILCEHVKTFDLSKRNAKFEETCPNDIFSNVIEMIEAFF